MCLFLRKRVLLDSIKGHLGGIFQTPPKMTSKKACLGVNFGAKFCEILVQRVFFLGRGNRDRVCYENLWSHMYATLVFECSPPSLWALGALQSPSRFYQLLPKNIATVTQVICWQVFVCSIMLLQLGFYMGPLQEKRKKK